MKRVAMPITFAIAFFIGTVFSHPNAWFMRAAETVSPSPGGEGRGEGGLQTKIQLCFRFFRQPPGHGLNTDQKAYRSKRRERRSVPDWPLLCRTDGAVVSAALTLGIDEGVFSRGLGTAPALGRSSPRPRVEPSARTGKLPLSSIISF